MNSSYHTDYKKPTKLRFDGEHFLCVNPALEVFKVYFLKKTFKIKLQKAREHLPKRKRHKFNKIFYGKYISCLLMSSGSK